MERRFSHVELAIVCGAILNVGCGVAPEGPTGTQRTDSAHGIGTHGEPILLGTPSNTAETGGWVLLAHRITKAGGEIPVGGTGSCSASVVRNDMILTARHCVTTDTNINGPPEGDWSNFTTVQMGTQNRVVTGVFPHPTLDAALLRVDSLFSVNGSRFGFNRTVASASVGATVSCFGYGSNLCVDGTGSTLRTADLPVTSKGTDSILLGTNSLSQNLWQGDSGSSCLSGSNLIGVASTAQCYVRSTLVDGASLNTWLYGFGSGLMTNIYPDAVTATAPLPAVFVAKFGNDALRAAPAVPQLSTVYDPPNKPGVMAQEFLGMWSSGDGTWQVQDAGGSSITGGSSFFVSWDTSVYSFKHLSTTSNNVLTTVSNSIIGATRLDNPIINNDPTAKLFVTRAIPGFADPVGVIYSGGRWLIQSEGGLNPVGTNFFVRAARPSEYVFVHHATSSNTQGFLTWLDNPNINGEPNARMLISHVYAQGREVRSPISLYYDPQTRRWGIFTDWLTPLPDTFFNVLVLPGNRTVQL